MDKTWCIEEELEACCEGLSCSANSLEVFEGRYMNKQDLTETVSLDVQQAFDKDHHQRILKKPRMGERILCG